MVMILPTVMTSFFSTLPLPLAFGGLATLGASSSPSVRFELAANTAGQQSLHCRLTSRSGAVLVFVLALFVDVSRESACRMTVS